MPDLFETEIGTVHLACSSCGAPLELATSALSVFGSDESVLCMDCLLRQGSDASAGTTVPLTERIRLIDETVDEFAAHLRNVLVRCIKPDLTWNREYGIDEWSDPADVVAAAYAPGVWYTVRRHLEGRDSSSDGN
ncbi:MAG: hypothetical protein JWO59_1333 [Chloroflexi bacterium]|nr:hypothetical protein [Chloroflexota bacterium]MDB5077232.1 hypothetical protein [Chloroflexota bacterium]